MSRKFDEAVDAAWGRFEKRLKVALETIDDDSFGIEVPGETWGDGAIPYVQFGGSGDWVRAEVSSNEYLDEACLLDPEQEAALAALGWGSPDDEHPNWWSEVRRDSLELLLPMVPATFRLVLGVVDPGFLVSNRIPFGDEPVVGEEPEETQVEAEEPVFGYPTDHDHLAEMVEQTLSASCELQAEQDPDGDFAMNTGVVPLWLRVAEDEPAVRLFSFVVSSVRDLKQARLEVGILNRRTPLLKFVLKSRMIVAYYELPAAPFVGPQLRHAINRMSELLNELAADTALRVSGRLWLEELAESATDLEEST